MFLIAGLGNPGKQYQHTRHNFGYLFLDYLTQILGLHFKTHSGYSLSQFPIEKFNCFWVKPTQYMNQSGIALQKIIHYYRIPLSQVIIIYDDLDFDFGKFKLKIGGRSGGHNGLASIIQTCPSNQFIRFRMGISRPKNTPMNQYVLENFSSRELEQLPDIFETAFECLKFILNYGIDKAMAFYHKSK